MISIAQVTATVSLIVSTELVSLPPDLSPDFGCRFADRTYEGQATDWRNRDELNWSSTSDHTADAVCEFQIVPLRKTGRLKFAS